MTTGRVRDSSLNSGFESAVCTAGIACLLLLLPVVFLFVFVFFVLPGWFLFSAVAVVEYYWTGQSWRRCFAQACEREGFDWYPESWLK